MKRTSNGTKLENDDILQMEEDKEYYYSNIKHMLLCARGCVICNIDNCNIIILIKTRNQVIISGQVNDTRVCSFSAPITSYLSIDLNII